ncbi:MAG: hypothetical protein ACK4Q5_07915 [Saprospiraceae bacterium]
MTNFMRFALVLAALAVVGPPGAAGEVIYSQYLEGSEKPIGNYLKWQTAKEVGMASFVIEKSTDGLQFFELTTIAAAGYSEVDKNYHFMDVGASDTKNYYRLKELADDGTSSINQPILVEKKMANVINVMSMTSTEVDSTFRVTADVMGDAQLTCTLTDMAGKVRESFYHKAFNGVNNIEVNVENLPAGTYKFTVQLDKEVETFVLNRVADERTSRPQVADTRKAKTGRQ